MKTVLALLAALAVAHAAHASCYSSYSYAPVYYPPKVVHYKPAVIVEPVVSYGAFYVGPGVTVQTTVQPRTASTPSAASATARADKWGETLLTEIRSMKRDFDRRLKALEGGGKTGPAPEEARQPQARLDGKQVLVARCSSCHQRGKAAEKGGGFVMFEDDGAAVQFTAEQMVKMIRAIDKGEMPKGKPLSNDEATAATEALHAMNLRRPAVLPPGLVSTESPRKAPTRTRRYQR